MLYIDKETHLRVNIYAPYKGFSKLDTPEIRERAGVVEYPVPPVPEGYVEDEWYRTEQQEFPYVVYTRKSDEQIEQQKRSKAQADARRYLADTDWYVTRFAETGREIPADVLGARKAARDII